MQGRRSPVQVFPSSQRQRARACGPAKGTPQTTAYSQGPNAAGSFDAEESFDAADSFAVADNFDAEESFDAADSFAVADSFDAEESFDAADSGAVAHSFDAEESFDAADSVDPALASWLAGGTLRADHGFAPTRACRRARKPKRAPLPDALTPTRIPGANVSVLEQGTGEHAGRLPEEETLPGDAPGGLRAHSTGLAVHDEERGSEEDAGECPAAKAYPDLSAEFEPKRMAVHRSQLLRLARRRVHNLAWAEDAVQDTLLAAYLNQKTFRGRGSVRSWLRGILEHKIHDRFREECRYTGADWLDDSGESQEDEAEWSRRGGAYRPQLGEDPMRICERRQTLREVSEAIETLPQGMRDAFTLQVLEDRPTEEVVERLGISENNCWIRVHRARKRLSALNER